MTGAEDVALIVIAKQPRPGYSKTRLCPPCSPLEASRLAAAALADTLAAVAGAEASRRVLVLDGRPGEWIPAGFEVIPQASGGLDLRLAAAFEAVKGPALLIGMDTPQVTPALLEASSQTLLSADVDAVLGLAPDGGYWSVGLRRAQSGLFEGVPMSTSSTGEAQRRRLESAGLEVELLPQLRDFDAFEVAVEVARECPGSRFALELNVIRAEQDRSPTPIAG